MPSLCSLHCHWAPANQSAVTLYFHLVWIAIFINVRGPTPSLLAPWYSRIVLRSESHPSSFNRIGLQHRAELTFFLFFFSPLPLFRTYLGGRGKLISLQRPKWLLSHTPGRVAYNYCMQMTFAFCVCGADGFRWALLYHSPHAHLWQRTWAGERAKCTHTRTHTHTHTHTRMDLMHIRFWSDQYGTSAHHWCHPVNSLPAPGFPWNSVMSWIEMSTLLFLIPCTHVSRLHCFESDCFTVCVHKVM